MEPLNDLHETHLGDYLRIINKRKFILINCIVIMAIIATIYSFKTRRVYQASVQILIERNTPQAVALKETQALDASDFDYYKTQYEILKSRSMAREVIQTLGLEDSEELKEKPSLIDLKAIKDGIQSFLVQVGLIEEPEDLDIPTDPYSKLVNQYLKKLSVNPIRKSRLVLLSFSGYSPVLITKVANKAADTYILKNIRLRSNVEEGAGKWLQERITETKKKLGQSEVQLQNFIEKNNIIGFQDNKQDISTQKLSEINTEVTRAKSERFRLETLKNHLESLANDPVNLLRSVPDSMKNKAIQELEQDYSRLETELAEESKKYAGQHPKILSLTRKKKIIEKRIPDEVQRIINSVRIDYRSALARENSLTGVLRQQKKTVMLLNKNSLKYNVLKREVESDRSLYSVLINRLKETGISSKNYESNIRIVDPAEVPAVPIKPRMLKNIYIFSGIGFLLGIFLIFLLESMDKTIRSIEDMENKLPFPFLGSIGVFSKGEGELPVVENPQSQRSEEFRIIRTNILYSSPDNPEKILMTSSCSPMEGKTTIVCNLAAAIAQMGKSVLVIDADLKKSRVHKVFNSTSEPGLVDYLFDRVDLKKIVHKTSVKGVSIIPRGLTTPYSAEILSSQKFKSLLAELKDQYDHILVDVPPTLHVSEAAIVARLCDGVVFVVRSGHNDVSSIVRALGQLSMGPSGTSAEPVRPSAREAELQFAFQGQTRILGVILNMIDYERDGGYYSYSTKKYKGYYNYSEKSLSKKTGGVRS